MCYARCWIACTSPATPLTQNGVGGLFCVKGDVWVPGCVSIYARVVVEMCYARCWIACTSPATPLTQNGVSRTTSMTICHLRVIET